MTVGENIAFPLQLRGVPKAEIRRRVNEALEMAGLPGFAGRRPRELSGGQQQRVALCRALVYRPPVILMDEPLGALDKKLRETLQLEISRLHRELGITFVFVTHDQEEALALSDRIAVFRDGRIEQVGTPAQLYESPVSRFVATFLGDSNVFPGRIRDGLVDTGWCTLHTAAAGPSGEPVALVVRPEHLRIGPAQGAGANTLSATVTDVVYQGAFRRVLVLFDGGGAGQVRDSAGTGAAVAVGDRVQVHWAAGAGVVVPDEAPGAHALAPAGAR
jgi:putative spermidine/putrescine transport system ATP-binding protein